MSQHSDNTEHSATTMLLTATGIIVLIILGLCLNGYVAQHTPVVQESATAERRPIPIVRLEAAKTPWDASAHPQGDTPQPAVNGYGLVTNGPDYVQNKINDALTRCLEVYGTPKYHPTHRITKDEFLTVTTCVNSTLGRTSK